MGADVIQLKVRTEFSFKLAFGPVKRIAQRCKDINSTRAAIVDSNTWGHVKWAKACAAVGVEPMFGLEFNVKQEDGTRPAAWVLMEKGRGTDFYRWSSAQLAEEFDHARSIVALDDIEGVNKRPLQKPGIVFAGAAFTDPALFDYIDVNPASPIQQRAAINLHRRTGKPLVVTSDNAYAAPGAADFGPFMAISGRQKMTPQHVMAAHEFRKAIRFATDDELAQAIKNTYEVAERCATSLERAPLIHLPGNLEALVRDGIKYRIGRGHLKDWTDDHEARIKRELAMIREKDFDSYFLVVADLVTWAKSNMLVGPGRGSSAGSLVCYLLRITEVNPLEHGLLFERFIDVTRSDLPDIDIDFNDVKRDDCFTYLASRHGQENVCRIGNVGTLKPKSAMKEVCRRLGLPDGRRFDVINVLIDYTSGDSRFGNSLEDTMTKTDVGRRFMEDFPQAKVLWDVENHAWYTGVHAAGVIVSNLPVNQFCTVGPDNVAHIDKPDAEYLNLLKIDALGLRTLGIIEDAGVVDNETLYDLAQHPNDPSAIGILNAGKFVGIFQFEGSTQRDVTSKIDVKTFRQIDHITALARPGPLGGGAAAKYFMRSAGREEVEYRHPSMSAYLGSTLGVILYQEQVMRIGAELGKMSWKEVTLMRKAMSGRKGNEFFGQLRATFMKGAAENGLNEDDAEHIWQEINTFGAWGMNASHTVSYSVVSYWCCWMKCYHAVAYAAACLRSAKDDNQTMELLRELHQEGIQYVPFDIDKSDVNWSVQDGKLVGGFMSLHGYGKSKATVAVRKRKEGAWTKKDLDRISAARVLYSELYPLTTKYKTYYESPEAAGCAAGSVMSRLDNLPTRGTVLTLGTVSKKRRRDKNEDVLIKRRGGEVMKGDTAFADIYIMDDTGKEIIVRVQPRDFEPIGRLALDNLVVGVDVVLVRGRRIPDYSMITAMRLRCLTNRKALQNAQDGTEAVG